MAALEELTVEDEAGGIMIGEAMQQLFAKDMGYERFFDYIAATYGEERAESLILGLMESGNHCAMLNKFAAAADTARLVGVTDNKVERIPKLSLWAMVPVNSHQTNAAGEDATTGVASHHSHRLFSLFGSNINTKEWSGFPLPGTEGSFDRYGVFCYYLLDAASILPVEALDVQPHHRVLDLCAAPGGKSLAILQRLEFGKSKGGQLMCNELSQDRRARLQDVLESYLPPEALSHTQVTGIDATHRSTLSGPLGSHGGFDRILVDAPCSSERHVLHKVAELKKWHPGRSKGMADRQFSLLTTALKLCRMGGRVVYSTCSLSKLENDGVVIKSIKFVQGKIDGKLIVRNVAKRMPFGEPTSVGWQVLPDNSNGWGPIYFSVIERVDS